MKEDKQIVDEVLKEKFPLGYCIGGNYEGYRDAMESALKKQREEIYNELDKLKFIMCLRDAEGDDEVSKGWREKMILRKEEVLDIVKGDEE